MISQGVFVLTLMMTALTWWMTWRGSLSIIRSLLASAFVLLALPIMPIFAAAFFHGWVLKSDYRLIGLDELFYWMVAGNAAYLGWLASR